MAIEKAIIIGAGISGIAVALALHRLKIGVFICDIKKQPGTIGGAINLMPSALRYLDHLGVLSKLESKGCTVHSIEIFSVHTTYKIADVNFSNVGKYGYHAMRILRADLLQAMLETLNEAGEEVQYGKSMVEISESAQGVEVRFDDGEMVSADLLLGCDGIHSHTRTMFVDPDRVPVYTGIAVAYGLLKASSITEPIHFKDTAVNTSRRGSLLISYYQPSRESIYLGAVMEVEEQASRESWKIRGADQQKMKEEIAERFHDAKIPCLGQMIREVGDLCLYPVHILGPGGKWSRGKVMLLGDAAHAMPPQGESTGIAIEDAVLLSHLLARNTVADTFNKYESLRKPSIDAAYVEANRRWGVVKDVGWLQCKIREWITPWYLWWTQGKREKAFAEDIRRLE